MGGNHRGLQVIKLGVDQAAQAAMPGRSVVSELYDLAGIGAFFHAVRERPQETALPMASKT